MKFFVKKLSKKGKLIKFKFKYVVIDVSNWNI